MFSGSQVVESGGTASGTTVYSGGTSSSRGGTRSTRRLNSGELDVFGTVSGEVIGSGATFTVESGAVASASTMLSGGTETVLGGGTDLGAQISAGAARLRLGERRDVFTGSQVVESGGTASGTVVYSGGL